jgi:hypothetical protein
MEDFVCARWNANLLSCWQDVIFADDFGLVALDQELVVLDACRVTIAEPICDLGDCVAPLNFVDTVENALGRIAF